MRELLRSEDGLSEAGIGWIPAVLERCDRETERHHFHTGHHTDVKPSEIFKHQMSACMVEEPIGLTLWPLIGEHNILAETDYPHADTPYPSTQGAYSKVFNGIPDHVVELVSHGNADRTFDWQMADEELLLSPNVSSWRSTLANDPFAAMKLRHDVAGTKHASSLRTAGTACTAMVLAGACTNRTVTSLAQTATAARATGTLRFVHRQSCPMCYPLPSSGERRKVATCVTIRHPPGFSRTMSR